MIQNKLQLNVFDVVPFMRQKAKKKEKERKREKQGIKRKQKKHKKEDKKKRTRERERERDREREIEKGGGKKMLRRNKGRHSKINKKCPFLGGNWFFFY